MAGLTYFLSDFDGTLCVAVRSTDFAEPRYCVSHYPTKYTVREFCREFDVKPTELRERVQIVETMPGEYAVVKVWESGGFMREGSRVRPIFTLGLPQGAKTMPANTTFEPVKKPRIGKGSRLEWDSGRWRIIPPKGKPRIVTV